MVMVHVHRRVFFSTSKQQQKKEQDCCTATREQPHMVNWRTLLPEQNEIQFGKKRNRKRETAARKKDLRTKLKGFSKLAGKMEVAAQKASTPSNSVEESLRRFLTLTMILRSPLDIHTRLELSGKRNWVPQRFLIQPPKLKTGTRSNAPKQLKLENTKSTFDKAAEQVATAFGHENTEVHERMRSLLQIFSYYSTLGLDGIRRHDFENFISIIENHESVRRWHHKCRNTSGFLQKPKVV